MALLKLSRIWDEDLARQVKLRDFIRSTMISDGVCIAAKVSDHRHDLGDFSGVAILNYIAYGYPVYLRKFNFIFLLQLKHVWQSDFLLHFELTFSISSI